MIRSIYRAQDGVTRTGLTPAEFPAALGDIGGLLWVDFEGEKPEACEPILRETFGFHPLAVDDALQESHVPKVDDWGPYVYVVLHAVALDSDSGEHVDTQEVDIFLGKNYVVTHRDVPCPAVDRVWVSCHRDERHTSRGVQYLAYRMADEMVAGYMPVFEQIDDAIDEIEDKVLNEPMKTATLERLLSIKRALLNLRRIITPLREVLNKLARDDYEVVDTKGRVYFRDVYDHLVRLHDINESMRDLVSGVLDIYLSVINNRLNDVMKTLTTITTLFMPISFIASFFGMNFFQPVAPELAPWTNNPAFLLMMALMLLLPFGMYWWVRRRLLK
jgi:magnesium transporter